ncbi:MAG TPA: lasso RiPP family leader peptide-containing protein [Acidimicrobiales bacterium]|nr:lasso RiPP family leader peptide-containing protein [Acidimicrobiales bacterium]
MTGTASTPETYEAPAVSRLGTVTELTQSGGNYQGYGDPNPDHYQYSHTY